MPSGVYKRTPEMKIYKPLSERHRMNMSNAKRGKRSNAWKDGSSLEKVLIRMSIEARLWREAVFAKDDFTCKKCDKKGVYLQAHHIQNFSQVIELRTSIENGITFCRECHRKFHKIYGYKNNTKEQVKGFIIKDN